MQHLTGARAWSLKARVLRSLSQELMSHPDCMDVKDWRRTRAIAENRVIEHRTVS